MSKFIFGSSLVAFVALVGAALAGEGPDPSAVAASCHGQKTQAAAGCHGGKAAKTSRTTIVQRVAARQESRQESRQEARASRQAARAAASSCHGQQQAAPVEVCECDCSDCNCSDCNCE